MDDVGRTDRRTPSLSTSDDTSVSSEPLVTRASSPTLANTQGRKPLPSLPPASRSPSLAPTTRSSYSFADDRNGEAPDWPLRPPPSLGFQPHRSPSPLRHDILAAANTEEIEIGDAVGLVIYEDDNPPADPIMVDDGRRSPQDEPELEFEPEHGTALAPARHRHQSVGRPPSSLSRASASIVDFPTPEPAPPPRPLFIDLFEHATILAVLLRYLSWPSFQAALRTCAAIRRGTFEQPDTRDLVLARFVPAYYRCAQLRDPEWFQDVPIEMHDLELLMISEEVHLYRYQTHALERLSALRPSLEMEDATERCAALTLAHSRFVLLLQSLVHSSTTPPSADDADEPPLPPPPRGLRELTFPSPLYFTGPDAKEKPPMGSEAPPRRPGVLRQPSLSTPSLPYMKSSASSSSSSSGIIASSDLGGHHHAWEKGRSPTTARVLGSLFGRGGAKVPLPPARKEPAALALYSSSWRRRMPTLPAPSRPFANTSRAASDEEVFGALRRPRRRFASVEIRGSWSSASTSSPREELPLPPRAPPLSPHDLRAAMRRTRAPVLRVFVPCAALTDAVLDACTAQLARAGLWELLSAGDLVCNLGYAPPAADADGGAPADEVRTWLLYDGHALRVFVPPAAPPLPRPGALPSPLYYAHVLPAQAPAGAGPSNPRFVLTLPALPAPPALALVPDFTALVRAPGAPRGRARVRKHVWTARMRATAAPGLGAGWAGEWVFEAPGTHEGRQGVLDAFGGGAQAAREWEIVRERSAAGKIWFRLIDDVSNTRTISSAH